MTFHSGFVAISGRPNVGKSTLLNRVLAQKIAIMSPKAQTTRNKIQGIYNETDMQIVFIDTPGIHKPKNQLGERMNRTAISATRGVEVILWIVDVTEAIGTGDEYVLSQLGHQEAPIFLVLNKIDLVDRITVDERKKEWLDLYPFPEIFSISAREGTQVDALMQGIKQYMPEGPKYYPDGQTSDHPEVFIMAELIREKILMFTREEVPHGVAVIIERNQINKNGTVEVDAAIIVERESQKGIVIGKNGSMLKKIGTMARIEMESLLGSKVLLHTFVRVESNWRNDNKYLNEFGYREEQ